MSKQLTRMEIRRQLIKNYLRKKELTKELTLLDAQTERLFVSDIKISDECHEYSEEEKVVKSKMNSSKKQRIETLGKISYVEKFRFEDTGEEFAVNRTKYLLRNGTLAVESLKKYNPFSPRYDAHFTEEYRKGEF